MRKGPQAFPEYSTVRVVKLIHADRWSTEGEPSVGDEGTVVDVAELDNDIWYTVESTEGMHTKWVAELSHDELAQVADSDAVREATKSGRHDHSIPREATDRSTPASRSIGNEARVPKKPAGRRAREERNHGRRRAARHLPDTDRTGSSGEVLVVLVSSLLGGVTAVVLVHVLVPAGPWIPALVLGVVSGLVGGLAAGTLVEAAVVVALLFAMAALVLAITTHPLLLMAVVSFSSGAAVGKTTVSIHNELRAPTS